MARVKGIFEPFKPYIRKQLEVRKEILANLNEEGTILNNARFNEKPEFGTCQTCQDLSRPGQ